MVAIVFATGAFAQDMTKEETLDYIKNAFETSAAFFLSGNPCEGTREYSSGTSYDISVELNYGNLIIKGGDYTTVMSITNLRIQCNSIWTGSAVAMYFPTKNLQDQERMLKAIEYLEQFVENDPFGNSNNSDNNNKSYSEYPKLSQSELIAVLGDCKSIWGINYGDTKDDVIRKFGEPKEINTEYNSFSYADGKTFVYYPESLKIRAISGWEMETKLMPSNFAQFIGKSKHNLCASLGVYKASDYEFHTEYEIETGKISVFFLTEDPDYNLIYGFNVTWFY